MCCPRCRARSFRYKRQSACFVNGKEICSDCRIFAFAVFHSLITYDLDIVYVLFISIQTKVNCITSCAALIFFRVIPSVKIHIRPALFRTVGKHHTARRIFCPVRISCNIFLNGVRTIPVRGKAFYTYTIVRCILTYPFRQEPSVAIHATESNCFNARSNAVFCFDCRKSSGSYIARNQRNFCRFRHTAIVKLTVNLNIDFFIYFVCTFYKVFKRCAIIFIFFIAFNNEIFFYEITFIPSYDIHIFGKKEWRTNTTYGKYLFNSRTLINGAIEYRRNLQIVFAIRINRFVCKGETGRRYVNIIVAVNPYTVCRCVFNCFPA